MPGQWDAPPCRSHVRYCTNLLYREQARHADQIRHGVPVLRSELLARNAASMTKKIRRLSGYEIHASMKLCFRVFDSSKEWRRLPTQVEFHEIALESSLHLIYSAEADAEMGTILAQNNWKFPLLKMLALAVPRRCGKSTAVAMFGAVCALTNPGRRVAIFSVTDRQAKLLHASILAFVTFLLADLSLWDTTGYLGPRIVSDSKSELKIEFLDGRVSYVNSYPASTDIRISCRITFSCPRVISLCACLFVCCRVSPFGLLRRPVRSKRKRSRGVTLANAMRSRVSWTPRDC